ncbi:MAG: NAD-dependent epimerase/dehydratase family protein [Betaproteobacteria bacterium]|nr:NAD-dependent epimerase/dehydratase family protein [Betaproteobacteria bacterium]
MRVFLSGASGYIGGSVAAALRATGHTVLGLVRSPQKAEQLRALGIEPVLGNLDDGALLARFAREADAVIHTADADHRAAVEAMLPALAGSGKAFIHTSGSSIVGDQAWGEPSEKTYEDETPFVPGPGRAARVAVNQRVLAGARDGVRAVVISPSLIYGTGRGAHKDSIQVPRLIALARKSGVARHIGRGENLWANVHIDDLADLYVRALAKAPAGASYYAENGENSMRQVCEAISRALGWDGRTQPMTKEESIAEFGEGPAAYTYGSNSRVRATRARRELGWSPRRDALLDTITA